MIFMFENGIAAHGKSHTLSKYYYSSRLADMARFYDQGEYHCDVPTPFAYEAMLERYGSDAKYIPISRKDAQTWYAGMLRHNICAHPVKHKQKRFFGTREVPPSDAFKRRFNGVVQPLYGRICSRLYPDAVLRPRYIKSFSV